MAGKGDLLNLFIKKIIRRRLIEAGFIPESCSSCGEDIIYCRTKKKAGMLDMELMVHKDWCKGKINNGKR
jgi:hypothetical protein